MNFVVPTDDSTHTKPVHSRELQAMLEMISFRDAVIFCHEFLLFA